MTATITDTTQLTPAWLTNVLRANGHLERGRVTHVKVSSPGETINAKFAHLLLRYSDDAIVNAPPQLFFKHTKPDRVNERVRLFNQKEAAYYQAIACTVELAIPCYGAAYSDELGIINLLLADMSATHQQWKDVSRPHSIHHFEGMVDCLARFHAYWWEHPRLGQDIGALWTKETLRTSLNVVTRRVERFFDFAGDKVSPARRAVYERLVCPDTWFKLWGRLTQRRGTTLNHNDAHMINFLFPRDPHKDHVILTDWQLYDVGVGAFDLGYMLILYLPPERRAAWQRPLFERYHDKLLEGGVGNYGWEDLWHDYGLTALRDILVVVTFWANGVSPERVWTAQERAFAAFAELDCASLL